MSLTIDEMKKALSDRGISLPGGRPKKEEYIKLYDEHIVLNNAIGDNYSSDEDNSQNSKTVTSTNSLGKSLAEEHSPKKLSNDELFKKLVEIGYNPGPVLDNTRSVYEKKYLQIMRGEYVARNASNGDKSVHLGHEEISDNEVEIGLPSGRNKLTLDRSLRESPKPSTSNRESTPASENTIKLTRISYIEKIPRGSSQRFIEPTDFGSLPTSRARIQNTGTDDYVGQWSPNIKRFTPTSTSSVKTEQNPSLKNVVVFVGLAVLIIALLVVVYHQWTINDPYKAIEADVEQEMKEFAARKADM